MLTAEILLTLRSPNAGWLATVLCALDEAMQDPSFDAGQRAVVREMLDRPNLPHAVAIAAHESLCEFEIAVSQGQASTPVAAPPASVSQRPKLTLCVANH